MLQQNRRVMIGLLGAVAVLSILLFTVTGGQDDWQYEPSPDFTSYLLPIAVGLGLLLLAWLGTSMYMIVTGGGNAQPRRRLGIWVLCVPIGLIILGGSLLFFRAAAILPHFILLVVGGFLLLLALAAFIVGIVHTVKKRVKLAIVPMACFLLLIIGILASLVVFMLSGGTAMGATATNTMQKSAGAAVEADLGYATGGAKDINNFRDNIDEGYLPIPSDIPYEGLFYEYYFDTGEQEQCTELFCPSYSTAVTQDPLSNETEHYITVGLNSNLKMTEFERKKLNMVLVLDISGSMSSGFSEYYYDRFGNRKQVENPTDKTKIQIATETLASLTKHLGPGDRLGIVLFNNNAHKAKPIRLVQDTDMHAIRNHLQDVRADGGTNMAAGMKMGTEMLSAYSDADKSEYENRIVFMTDAMPNLGTHSEGGLLSMMEQNAQQGLHTTFVGIGVDFNTELVDAVTAVKGANSFSVHSAKQFRERMDKEFKYMVTPLVFNLSLQLHSEGYNISKVYGSTAAEEATGTLMEVNTLFPSPSTKNRTKGGIVLAQLEKSANSPIDLEVSYEDREGEQHTTQEEVTFSEDFDNTGIRKAVLLSRYADLMKQWMVYERDQIGKDVPEPVVREVKRPGIEPPRELGEWERQSDALQVSATYEKRFTRFARHFESEMDAIGDETLSQELKILEGLADH